MIRRKLRKLKNNPHLFFKDMMAKRKFNRIHSLHAEKKIHGTYKYTIVSAVYGVEEYLNDFFQSITNQTLDFEENIKLIMVDDGSLDGSKNIILKWSELYPNNIQYLHKTNGGQASARNFGMKFATGDWITFIDPDDTLDKNYFLNVDKFAAQKSYADIALISCNCIFNIQGKGLSNKHPLRHRFNDGNRYVKIDDMVNDFQLSASTAFFNLRILEKSKLLSATDIKPNFEDGHFVTRYLLKNRKNLIGFCEEAKYLYLKRQDSTSTLDGSLTNSRRYTEVLEKGYLDVLKIAKKDYSYVPIWLQNEILYELFWLIKHVLNNSQRLNFMSDSDKNKFQNLLLLNFTYIDSKTILDFPLCGCWFYYKKGILNLFKNESTDFEITYLDSSNSFDKTIRLRYYSDKKQCIESITCNDIRILPTSRKIINSDFLDKIFIYEHLITFDIKDLTGEINLYVNGIKSRISINGEQHRHAVPIEKFFLHSNLVQPSRLVDIANYLRAKSKENKYKNAWLLMDRDTQADDNAEHMYRYIQKNHQEINIFFVLRRKSHDWNRLKNDGFKLLAFGSSEHNTALAWAEHLISSHADHYIVSKLNPKIRFATRPIRYTFLQHGVIKDDLSGWLNRKPFDIFITTTNAEYNSIISPGSKYKFTSQQVVKTGLARHDKLYELSKVTKRKNLLIMPTWRNGIVGKATGQGNSRLINEDFFKTEFAIQWKNFLHSDNLKKFRNRDDTNIIFFPHANITPYIDGFELPEYITTMSHSPELSIQEVFASTHLLVTDYSSVAFDLAYINIPVLYFQFDREQVFSGDFHIYKQGYFDYEKDGFGPVCTDQESLNKQLDFFYVNNYNPNPQYSERIKNTFSEERGTCCSKTFSAINSLNSRKTNDPKNEYETALTEAHRAEVSGYYELAKTRYILSSEHALTTENKNDALFNALRCAAKSGDIEYIKNNSTQSIENLHPVNNANVFVLAYYEKWNELARIFAHYNFKNSDEDILSLALRVSIECGNKYQNIFMITASIMNIDKSLWKAIKNERWEVSISILEKCVIKNFYLDQLKLEMLLKLHRFAEAEVFIDSLDYRLQRWQFHRSYARLRAQQGKFARAIWHYNRCKICDNYELPDIDIHWLNIKNENTNLDNR